jgi:hypothetical protein
MLCKVRECKNPERDELDKHTGYSCEAPEHGVDVGDVLPHVGEVPYFSEEPRTVDLIGTDQVKEP